jgi:hypothetical protein
VRNAYLGGIVIAVAALVACSPAPQLTRRSEQVDVFRTQYFESYANDPLESEIRKGIVHRRMNFMQVLAAWGLPNIRTGQAVGDETWTYFAVDEHTQMLVSYELAFTGGSLTRWAIGHSSGMTLLTPDDLSGLPSRWALREEVPTESGLQQTRK